MDKIKVAIVDDDLTWIKMITDFVHKEEDIVVLWSAGNKENAINRAKGEDVDIILMDIKLDGDEQDFEGILATKKIAEISKAKIIIMTSFSQEELIKNSICAGAVNYVLKEDYRSIPTLLRLSYNRVSPIEVIFKDYNKTKSELELSELTPTEKELYLLKKQGHSIMQIALKTNKSEGTVRNQLSKVYKKLKNKR